MDAPLVRRQVFQKQSVSVQILVSMPPVIRIFSASMQFGIANTDDILYEPSITSKPRQLVNWVNLRGHVMGTPRPGQCPSMIITIIIIIIIPTRGSK
jgi:hypothetical protein